MGLSRRSLFRAGTLAGLAASVPFGSAVLAGPKPPSPGPTPQTKDDSLPYLNMRDFSDQIGTPLALRRQTGTASLRLVEVRDLAKPALRDAPALVGEVFSVTFSGPAGLVLRQDVYGFDHPRLGSFSLLIVPGGLADDGSRLYTAIINRQIP